MKVLESAVANAEHNNSSDLDELIVKNVLVDEGPYGKRHRPRARGRVNQIIKRTSHITIVVSDGQEEKNNGTKSTSNRFQTRYFCRVHSKWYAGSKDYSSYLLEDYRIREYLKKQLENALSVKL